MRASKQLTICDLIGKEHIILWKETLMNLKHLKRKGRKDWHGSFYFIGKKLFQQNIRINQNISTMDIILAPTHKPIIPPMFEIRLILFKGVLF